MEKNKCQVISWNAIPTDVLILTYCNEFNCDFRHKKTLEEWAEAHSQSCRYYIKDALEKNYTKDELIKLYFSNYVKVLNYISFDFKGETIELPINDEEIEPYDGYNLYWSYWCAFSLSNGECYDVEVYREYQHRNKKVVVEGEVYVNIYELENDEVIKNLTTVIKKV